MESQDKSQQTLERRKHTEKIWQSKNLIFIINSTPDTRKAGTVPL